MASYSEVLWTEQEYGKDDAAYYLLGEARNYLQEDKERYRRPIVTHIYREAIELYDRHLYEKGACVYHMIRSLLGEELFERAIHAFVQDNAHKTVETIDLLRAIEKATGYNLLYLFDQYVFRGGHPDYKVSYSWDGDGQLAKLTVSQTQVKENDKDLFNLKIPVAFNYLSGENKTFTLAIKEKEQSFYFPLEKKPDFVSFDLGNNYLKTVELDYPLPELKAQLKYDPDPISRIYAAGAIAKKGGLEAINTLAESLREESFWAVRLEVAKELGKIKLDQAGTALMIGLEDQDTRVRRAAIEGLGQIKTPESYSAVKQCLEKGDASYYTEAAAARCLGGMVGGNLKEKETEVIELLKTILRERAGWNEIVRGGAIGGLSRLTTSPVAAELIGEYAKLGVPGPLRLAAIRALGAVSTGQTPDKLDAILEQLDAISAETFFLTQVAVASALEQMETPKAIGILNALAQQTPDGRVRRLAEEAIKKVQKNLGPDKALKELREEFDKLKQENQELKSRLAKLEAKSPLGD
jgi:aminopeptidase N